MQNINRETSPQYDNLGEKKDMFNTRYIVVDTETSPHRETSPMVTDIIEIGWTIIEESKLTSSYSSLIKPTLTIPSNVSDTIGITNYMVRDAPTICKIIPDLIEEIDKSIIVGHNLQYDLRIIKESIKREDPSNEKALSKLSSITFIDTMSLFSKLFPQRRRRVKDMIIEFGIQEATERHRAGADSYNTASSFLKMLEILNNRYHIKDIRNLMHYSKTGNPYIQESLFS